MYQLNAEKEEICFKDIQRENLPEILRWYNDTPEFEFATGVDAPISLDKLSESFEKVASSGNDFFAGIYIAENAEMIGFLKGMLKEKPCRETGEENKNKPGDGNEGVPVKDRKYLREYEEMVKRGNKANYCGNMKKSINRSAWISILTIKPECRRKGYGGKAVELLLDCLKKNAGVREVYLAVAAENSMGKAFWEGEGFIEIKRIKSRFAASGRLRNAVIMHRTV